MTGIEEDPAWGVLLSFESQMHKKSWERVQGKNAFGIKNTH